MTVLGKFLCLTAVSAMTLKKDQPAKNVLSFFKKAPEVPGDGLNVPPEYENNDFHVPEDCKAAVYKSPTCSTNPIVMNCMEGDQEACKTIDEGPPPSVMEACSDPAIMHSCDPDMDEMDNDMYDGDAYDPAMMHGSDMPEHAAAACSCWANEPEHESFCESGAFTTPDMCQANGEQCHWGCHEYPEHPPMYHGADPHYDSDMDGVPNTHDPIYGPNDPYHHGPHDPYYMDPYYHHDPYMPPHYPHDPYMPPYYPPPPPPMTGPAPPMGMPGDMDADGVHDTVDPAPVAPGTVPPPVGDMDADGVHDTVDPAPAAPGTVPPPAAPMPPPAAAAPVPAPPTLVVKSKKNIMSSMKKFAQKEMDKEDPAVPATTAPVVDPAAPAAPMPGAAGGMPAPTMDSDADGVPNTYDPVPGPNPEGDFDADGMHDSVDPNDYGAHNTYDPAYPAGTYYDPAHPHPYPASYYGDQDHDGVPDYSDPNDYEYDPADMGEGYVDPAYPYYGEGYHHHDPYYHHHYDADMDGIANHHDPVYGSNPEGDFDADGIHDNYDTNDYGSTMPEDAPHVPADCEAAIKASPTCSANQFVMSCLSGSPESCYAIEQGPPASVLADCAGEEIASACDAPHGSMEDMDTDAEPVGAYGSDSTEGSLVNPPEDDDYTPPATTQAFLQRK